ncbi:MAG: hypothetical protein ACETVR_00150 [Candidatus Bathyarchaeia archaeon]
MPSVPTNYYYTLLSLAAVGTLLLCSFQVYDDQIRGASEAAALMRVLESVAAEGCELLSLVSATNSSAQLFIQLPSRIGERLYWMRLRSAPAGAWLEGGFGEEWSGEPECRVYLPKGISASGSYAGGEGTLRLRCYVAGSNLHLELSAQREG